MQQQYFESLLITFIQQQSVTVVIMTVRYVDTNNTSQQQLQYNSVTTETIHKYNTYHTETVCGISLLEITVNGWVEVGNE